MGTKLRRLTFSGLRSFSQEAVIEFPDSGLVLVRGLNKDTGGSSGSGKSSVLLAIAYAFGYCPFPATDLRAWDGTTLQVTVEFDSAEGPCTLTRGPGSASLTVGDETTQGSAKAVEERLQSVLGLNKDLLSALTYRGQRKPGLFLSMADQAKKEFLGKLLGTEGLEASVEDAKESLQQLSVEVKTATQVRDHLRGQLEGIRVPDLVLEDEEAFATEYEALKAEQQRLETALGGLTSGYERTLEAEVQLAADMAAPFLSQAKVAEQRAILLTKKLESPIEQNRFKLEKLERVLASGRRRLELLKQGREKATGEAWARAEQLRAAATEARLIRKDLEGISAEIRKLDQELCPTCERQWDAARAHKDGLLAKAREKYTRLKSVDVPDAQRVEAEAAVQKLSQPSEEEQAVVDGIQRLEVAIATESQRLVSEVEMVKSGIREALAVARSETETAMAEAYKYRRTVLDAPERATRTIEKEIRRTEQDIEVAATKAAAVLSQLRMAEESNKRARAVHDQMVAERDRTAAALTEEQNKLAVLQVENSAESDFIELAKGFLASIFDEILDEISDEANTIMASFPNVAHCSVRLVSESLTQKGTVKKSIVPVVSVAGREAPLSSGCSGGMITAIELAVDLAIIAVISRRTGVVPGWLVLDEAFEGLGPVEKECCLEILQSYSQDRLVLVVDHASEFKELFARTINVMHQGGKSLVGETT